MDRDLERLGLSQVLEPVALTRIGGQADDLARLGVEDDRRRVLCSPDDDPGAQTHAATPDSQRSRKAIRTATDTTMSVRLSAIAASGSDWRAR